MKNNNLLGLYRPGRSVVFKEFLNMNMPEVAKRFGMTPAEIHIACELLGDSNPALAVGTPKAPIEINGKLQKTPHKLRVIYNCSNVQASLGDASLMPAKLFDGFVAGTFWYYVALAFRHYMQLEAAIDMKDLIRRRSYNTHQFDHIYIGTVQKFLGGFESGQEVRRELDAGFVANYIRLMVMKFSFFKEPFNFEAVVNVIKHTTESNASKLPVIQLQ